MEEDDAQKHLQLKAVEDTRAGLGSNKSGGCDTALPNAEVSVIPPCLATVHVSQAEPFATSGYMNISWPRNLYGYPSSGIPHRSRTSPETLTSVLNARSFPLQAPSLPGTGLHLPSILNTEVDPKDGMGVLGEMPLSGDATILARWPNSSISYQAPVDTEAPLISSPLLNHIYGNEDDIERMAFPPEKSSTASENADGFTKSAQISTDNKGKKPRGEGNSLRCSCKKTNCLKLYCDCFASEFFCAEDCQCQDCNNKSEDEETISQTKQEIRFRLPQAFAPKIIRPVTNFPNIEGDSRNMITTSGRHRVGCNCRKSLCMKNYCECFKGRVGCSSACRCENCENAFGVRDGSAEIGEMEGEPETVKVLGEMTKSEQCHHASKAQYSWNSPVDSISRTRFATAGQGTPPFSSNYQASGSPDADNFGSFSPHCDNFAGGIIFSPSNLQRSLFQGSDQLSVNSLPLTGESINGLEPESNSGLGKHNCEILGNSSSSIEAVKTNSPNRESLYPYHKNIQEIQSSLSRRSSS